MPVYIDPQLPAVAELREENIILNPQESTPHRHISVAILNLMPLKKMTETDLLRILSFSPLHIDVTLVDVDTHVSKNTPKEHIDRFYKKFHEIRHEHFDGFMITGAPVEKIDFEDVDYWQELTEIFQWSRTHARATMYICWAAFAGLYHHYGVKKHVLSTKISGVFAHRVHTKGHPLFRGFDDEFFVPHSRFTEVDREQVENNPALTINSTGEGSGIYIVTADSGREIYITGHSEYSPGTLDFEYHRDLAKGMNPIVPRNYYRNDDPNDEIIVRWRAHANLLFSNWIHYFVNPESLR